MWGVVKCAPAALTCLSSFVADAVKSSEDEEDDESSSEENKLSNEQSTSNEKIPRELTAFIHLMAFLCENFLKQE